MSDYISRQAAIDALAGWKISPIVLDPVPSADVRENVKAEWIEKKPMNFGKCVNGLGSIFKCSVCGEEISCCTTNYCPNCGADMRGKSNDKR